MRLRHKLRITAIALILGYSVIRFFLVRAVLAGYGVNPWLFLLLDASSGVLYVIGLEHLVVALRSKDQADHSLSQLLLWSALAAVGFAIPYAYIYMSSRELPSSLTIGLSVIILFLALNALVGIIRRIRRRA